MNRYFYALIVATLSESIGLAQNLQPAPRLVVNIAIDQLRTDYIEQFSPLYGADGFRRLLSEGCVYESASYPFQSVDRASAIATIATGTTPYYNNIVGSKWLDRNTLRPILAIEDKQYLYSPAKMLASTISDELKVSTSGAALVYGVAEEKDAAILSAGHAANGAFWIDENTHKWLTSEYYPDESISWLMHYQSANPQSSGNKEDNNGIVAKLAIDCVNGNALGKDEITDYLAVTLSAKGHGDEKWNNLMESTYVKLDQALGQLISNIESNVGKDRVLFILTGTGYAEEPEPDYQKYKIPTGTFYIDRTAQLLNMYLGAIYGPARYVETSFHNQIYLDRKLVEDRHINFSEMISRSKDFIIQLSGVRAVNESPYSPAVSGDLLIDISPGWQVINEETGEKYVSRSLFASFPIVIYGADTKPERISTPVTADRIAPTIAKSIHIRAPNACSASPLK